MSRRAAVGLGVVLVLLAARFVAAARFGLFGDEAFYWQCAQRPAAAYVDHPATTAMLVRLGTGLVDGTLGVRLLFVLLSTALIPLLFVLARPLVGSRDAALAAASVLLLPGITVLGLLAIPDVPAWAIMTTGLIATGHARRSGRLTAWLTVGLIGALGLATHYRCLLFPAALGLHLVLSPTARRHLATPGPWLAFGTMALGLAPVLLFNLDHDFEPFRYQMLERHQAAGGFIGLLYQPLEQAALVTPLLYVALLGTLVSVWRRGRAGDDGCHLIAVFAGLHVILFFTTSFFTDDAHASVHWPLPGYLPLLAFLPGELRRFAQRGPRRRARRVLAALAPGMAGAATAVVFFDLLTGWIGMRYLERPVAGWVQLADRVAAEIPADGSIRPVIVGDNYVVAAELEFELRGLAGAHAGVYVLDHPKNHDHGRALQYTIWNRDERALGALGGGAVAPVDALVVVEQTAHRRRHIEAWREHVRSRFVVFEQLDELAVGPADKPRVLELYRARGVRPVGDPAGTPLNATTPRSNRTAPPPGSPPR